MSSATATAATAAAAAAPMTWAELFECAAEDEQAQRAFAQQITDRLHALAQGTKDRSKLRMASAAVGNALAIPELNSLLGRVDTGPGGKGALAALNAVIRAAPTVVSAALAEHGTPEALMNGFHKRIDLNHELSPAVYQALHAICVRCEDVYGHSDMLAVKPEVTEAAVTAVIYLGSNPDRLARPDALATANRAVQMCWCLCRHGTSASSLVANTFATIDLAGRVLHLAGLLSSTDFKERLPDPNTLLPASISPSPGPGAGGATVGELCVSLVTICSSVAAALLGLGGPLDASAGGLHSLRAWLLRRPHLQALRDCLAVLCLELPGGGPLLGHLRQAAVGAEGAGEAEGEAKAGEGAVGAEGAELAVGAEGKAGAEVAVGAEGPTAGAEGAGPESSSAAAEGVAASGEAGTEAGAATAASAPAATAPSPSSAPGPAAPTAPAAAAAAAAAYEESLRASVEGAARNLLTLLLVPLLCADPGNAREVSALSSFALQFSYLMHQEGYAEVLKGLSERQGPYRGIYLAFFCAASDMLLQGLHTVGDQFSEWGVQLDRDEEEDEVGDASTLFVPTTGGVDAATAQAFIAAQVTELVQRSQKVHKVLVLSQRAAASRQLQQRQGQGQSSAPAPASTAAASAPGPSAAASRACSYCGTASALKACVCGTTRYCCKTCQTAHFPSHRDQCHEARRKLAAATAIGGSK